MDSSEIKVSICCLVYNHEKYLRKCLDGFIMQKTNFKYEVLIHDDASTDSSPNIIKEYESKYPDIIKPIYQKENQFSKGIKIGFTYQYPRVKGKYIAFCEGDDYWCDENKLQIQIEAMERNPSCTLCSHRVEWINESGMSLGKSEPIIDIKHGFITQDEFIKHFMCCDSYPFRTNSYFIKSSVITDLYENGFPDFYTKCKVGDVPILLLCATKGDIYYIDKRMSYYRRGSLGSWTVRIRNNEKRYTEHITNMVETLERFDEYTEFKYNQYIIYRKNIMMFNLYLRTYNIKKLTSKEFIDMFKELPLKQRIYYYIIGYMPWTKKIYNKMKGK